MKRGSSTKWKHLTRVSGIAFVISTALWLQSEWYIDGLIWASSRDRKVSLEISRGSLRFERWVFDRPEFEEPFTGYWSEPVDASTGIEPERLRWRVSSYLFASYNGGFFGFDFGGGHVDGWAELRYVAMPLWTWAAVTGLFAWRRGVLNLYKRMSPWLAWADRYFDAASVWLARTRMFSPVAVLFALMWVAVVVFWVRSYRITDMYGGEHYPADVFQGAPLGLYSHDGELYAFYSGNGTFAEISFCYWRWAILFFVMPAIWFRYHWFPRVRRGEGCCLKCGYDLTGNQSGVCPECGMGIVRPVEGSNAVARLTS